MKAVFVGLSGGVDSAVSAYLLKKEGYNVVGAFIKGWEPDFLPCTGADDRLQAMRVAAHLQIPFVTVDLSSEYKREVVDYFVAEYRKGRTPNPDVMCNRTIKFGAFWDYAKKNGANYIATGHYAQNKIAVSSKQNNDSHNLLPARCQLLTSRDKEKDQTYFLWTLTQKDLVHSMFPVGMLEKKDVRLIAEKIQLPNAERKDSQGLCFLGHVDMHDFLKRYLPTTSGSIIDGSNRKKIGEHDGAWFYTLGQHIGVSSASRRFYVVEKNSKRNEIIVSDRSITEHATNTFTLTDVNWISGKSPAGTARARYRYRQPLMPVSVFKNRISFLSPELIASGQSLVLYDEEGSTCIGGGIVL